MVWHAHLSEKPRPNLLDEQQATISSTNIYDHYLLLLVLLRSSNSRVHWHSKAMVTNNICNQLISSNEGMNENKHRDCIKINRLAGLAREAHGTICPFIWCLAASLFGYARLDVAVIYH